MSQISPLPSRNKFSTGHFVRAQREYYTQQWSIEAQRGPAVKAAPPPWGMVTGLSQSDTTGAGEVSAGPELVLVKQRGQLSISFLFLVCCQKSETALLSHMKIHMPWEVRATSWMGPWIPERLYRQYAFSSY